MANCRDIESQLAAYVDGEARPPSARRRDAPRALSRRAAAGPGRRASGARSVCVAPRGAARLRARGAAPPLRGAAPGRGRPPESLDAAPWCRCRSPPRSCSPRRCSLLFGWGSSVETYAAQLGADHLKCFQVPAAAPPLARRRRCSGKTWQAANGWPLKVAATSASEQLQLLGVRRCGSSRGRVAHIFCIVGTASRCRSTCSTTASSTPRCQPDC